MKSLAFIFSFIIFASCQSVSNEAQDKEQILAIMKEAEKDIASLCHVFETVPQHLENVKLAGISAAQVMNHDEVQHAITDAQNNLNGSGRVLVRPSGTEPLIRVMAEGDNETQVKKAIGTIVQTIRETV